jgi:hypothetical protein
MLDPDQIDGVEKVNMTGRGEVLLVCSYCAIGRTKLISLDQHQMCYLVGRHFATGHHAWNSRLGLRHSHALSSSKPPFICHVGGCRGEVGYRV